MATDPTPPPVADEGMLPCPFCGASGEVWKGARVVCWSCGAEGPDNGAEELAEKVSKWNTRAALRPPEPSPEYPCCEKCAQPLGPMSDDTARSQIRWLSHKIRGQRDELRRLQTPTPSTDDAAVLNRFAAAAHSVHPSVRRAFDGAARQKEYEESRAAVLARMSDRRAVIEACAEIADAELPRTLATPSLIGQDAACRAIASAIRSLAPQMKG